jgi:DNA-3-methyladenine glycosylase
MHWCMNIVTGPDGQASAVLVRAGEVVEGIEAARQRRGPVRDRDLARGPARLCAALGIGREQNGADLFAADSPVRLTGSAAPRGRVLSGPRVGVSRAAQLPWRFWLAGEPTVSSYRPHTSRPRRTGA